MGVRQLGSSLGAVTVAVKSLQTVNSGLMVRGQAGSGVVAGIGTRRRDFRAGAGRESALAYAWKQVSAALMLRFPDPPTSQAIFDLDDARSAPLTIARWRVATDKAFGGCSEAQFDLYEEEEEEEDDDVAQDGEAGARCRFGRFSGVLSTRLAPGETRIRRSGMCSVRADIAGSTETFDTLAMRVRRRRGDCAGDVDAEFIVNLRTENWIGPDARRDMMWQHFLRLPLSAGAAAQGGGGAARDDCSSSSHDWVDVRMALDDFYLTYRGRLVENDTDMGERLESMSISVANTTSHPPKRHETDAHSSLSSSSSPSPMMHAEGNHTSASGAEASETDSAAAETQDMAFCLDIRAIWLERQRLHRRARGGSL